MSCCAGSGSDSYYANLLLQCNRLMWYKINRLAMTIYPQWTQGREVNVGGIKFIQPLIFVQYISHPFFQLSSLAAIIY